jgi:hypothetical protein
MKPRHPSVHQVELRITALSALFDLIDPNGWPVDRIENHPSQIRDTPRLLTCKKSSQHPAF